MTTNLQLLKVSDDVYQDDSVEAHSKWIKGLRRLDLDLFDLSAIQGVKLGFKRLRDPLTDITAAGIDGIIAGQRLDRDRIRDEAYISARGRIAKEGKSLLLINPSEGEAACFREFSVTIRPTSVTFAAPGSDENEPDNGRRSVE